MALGSIPLAPYATTGTADVASSIQPLIVDHDAVLLANHGVVTAGDTLQDAFMRMETVEHFAHICLVARQLGCPSPSPAISCNNRKLAPATRGTPRPVARSDSRLTVSHPLPPVPHAQ